MQLNIVKSLIENYSESHLFFFLQLVFLLDFEHMKGTPGERAWGSDAIATQTRGCLSYTESVVEYVRILL